MLYAERPALRTRQMALDGGLAVWTVAWVRIGMWARDQVERLGTPPEKLADAGRAIERAGEDGRDAVDGIPAVGGGLGDLFGGVGRSGTALVDAGRTAEGAAGRLALLIGLLVALVPIVWLAGRLLPARIAWAREATAAATLRTAPAATELFALRALAHRPLAELLRAEADPMTAYNEGRTAALAEVELRHLGLVPAPGPAVSGPERSARGSS